MSRKLLADLLLIVAFTAVAAGVPGLVESLASACDAGDPGCGG